MYFHLIWIKEKDWKNIDLDFLIQWWDEDFIRKFLWERWVVIVSITEFKEDVKSFGNIKILVQYKDTDIEILIKWDDLKERAYFFISIWLAPHFFNFVENPIPEEEMKQMIDSISLEIKNKIEQLEKEKMKAEMVERKKFSEDVVNESINIININIERIEQFMKISEWILSWIESKRLDNYLNEMKKIRLWTNFNRMASLILETHSFIGEIKNRVFEKNDSQKFLIDQNSSVTNIDVLSDILELNMVKEKWTILPNDLTFMESIENMIWPKFIFVRLLNRDFKVTAKHTSVSEFFDELMRIVEDILIILIMVVSLSRLSLSLLWNTNVSLYLLPALWWLWLLVYLFNGLKLKWLTGKIILFIILALIYRFWLVLLLGTFAL